jgi:hypothetical protein
MPIPSDDAPDNAISTRRKGREAHFKECWIRGVYVPVSIVYLLATRILNAKGAKDGLQGTVEPDANTGWRNSNRCSHSRLGVFGKDMAPRYP